MQWHALSLQALNHAMSLSSAVVTSKVTPCAPNRGMSSFNANSMSSPLEWMTIAIGWQSVGFLPRMTGPCRAKQLNSTSRKQNKTNGTSDEMSLQCERQHQQTAFSRRVLQQNILAGSGSESQEKPDSARPRHYTMALHYGTALWHYTMALCYTLH